ncbi:thymidylate kinase [Cryptosporidium parvum Iowa II]|uniref:dTMP kinase n=1 Tax=Cryptosporidium parvum (strain Iowa II) TaxID=353152 RepID=A3FQP1_CRYPI|nr:thymidylate kinase [Cryptosporidium parvum Iowa II]EAZ51226.1 thymidylate kinase [Cryptosporidium parvum Iowa II]
MLDGYLGKSIKMAPQVSHLLFTANRWELNNYIKENLENGIDVVCDRYSFSGIAYSSGAINLDFEWCKSREQGLISPDIVVFLEVNLDLSSTRSGFGVEIYENISDQISVRKVYQKFSNYSFWRNINASQSPDVSLNIYSTYYSFNSNIIFDSTYLFQLTKIKYLQN